MEAAQRTKYTQSFPQKSLLFFIIVRILNIRFHSDTTRLPCHGRTCQPKLPFIN